MSDPIEEAAERARELVALTERPGYNATAVTSVSVLVSDLRLLLAALPVPGEAGEVGDDDPGCGQCPHSMMCHHPRGLGGPEWPCGVAGCPCSDYVECLSSAPGEPEVRVEGLAQALRRYDQGEYDDEVEAALVAAARAALSSPPSAPGEREAGEGAALDALDEAIDWILDNVDRDEHGNITGTSADRTLILRIESVLARRIPAPEAPEGGAG